MVRESGGEPIWYAPVPQESMEEMRGCGVRDWKTPWDIVERQMLPRQTKRIEVWRGEDDMLEVWLWLWRGWWDVQMCKEYVVPRRGRGDRQVPEGVFWKIGNVGLLW
jgi:hypothetical protein